MRTISGLVGKARMFGAAKSPTPLLSWVAAVGATLGFSLGLGPKTAGANGIETAAGAPSGAGLLAGTAFAGGKAFEGGTALGVVTAGVTATAAKGRPARPIRAAEKLKRRTPKPWNYD
jgi:hypothetical protein